jgi:hypothetical protein
MFYRGEGVSSPSKKAPPGETGTAAKAIAFL